MAEIVIGHETQPEIVVEHNDRSVVIQEADQPREIVIGAPATIGVDPTNAVNVGGGDAEVFRDKTGFNLNLRTISGTGGVAVSENGDVIEVDGSAVSTPPGGVDRQVQFNNALTAFGGADVYWTAAGLLALGGLTATEPAFKRNAAGIQVRLADDSAFAALTALDFALGAGGSLATHAARHQHGGADEVATANAASNAIPKAAADGKFNAGWIDDQAHDSLGGGALHAAATTSVNGFMAAADKVTLGELDDIRVDTQEPNGFIDRADSTISKVDGTRTFTIAPAVTTFDFYADGQKYTKSAAQNVVWPDLEGLHFFYFDETGVLQTTQNFSADIITRYAFASILYWDATNGEASYFGEERHGATMDGDTHLYLHTALGARWLEGLSLGDLTTDATGNLDPHAQFSAADGAIRDEDIQIAIADGAPQDLAPKGQLPVFYRLGATGVWRRKVADGFPVIYNGAPPAYVGALVAWNEFTGATWQLTDAGNNNYVLSHVFATNGIAEPVIVVCGQASYGTVGEAREGAEVELNQLFVDGLPFAEFTPLASVIFQTANAYSNTPKARVRSTADGDDYIDWRGGLFSPSGGGAAGIPAHASTHNDGGTDELANFVYSLGRAGGQTVFGGTAAGDILTLQGANNAPDLGRVQVNSPIDSKYNTIDNTTPAEAFAFRWSPTATVSAFIGGCLQASAVLTTSGAAFIPAVFSNVMQMNIASTLSFAADTFINHLPVIRNQGNFGLLNEISFNMGVVHERNSAGTSAVAVTTGFSFSPQSRASLSGAVLTRTDMTAVNCQPTFSTVAGSTVNMGTVCGLQVSPPAVALFQPALGAENMAAQYGLQMNANTFATSGNKAAVRNLMTDAADRFCILNDGGARSDWGGGDFQDLNHITQPYDLAGRTLGASGDWQDGWAGAGFYFQQFNGTADQMRWSNPSAQRFLLTSEDGAPEINIDASKFSLGAQTGSVGNQVGVFIAGTRTTEVNGGWSDFLLTQGGNLTVDHTMGQVFGWTINAPSMTLGLGSVTDAGGLLIGGNVNQGTNRYGLQVLSSPSGGTLNYCARFSGAAGVRIDGLFEHQGSTLGVFGSTPVTQPTVTGSRAGNSALASLLTQLASLGLIIDSTT